MSDAVLPLLIAVPLLLAVAPLLLGLWYDDVGWPVATGGSLLVTAMATYLLWTVSPWGDGPARLTHNLAGYPPTYGIQLVGDGLAAIFALLIGVVSTAVLVYARTTGPESNAFYSGYLLLVGGLTGMTLTGDLFNLFVFLEIVGLVTYALVASNQTGEAAYGALKYLFLGTVGASCYLIGVGYLLVATGTLNMGRVQLAIADLGYTDPLVQAAFGFVLVGFMLKIAIFPLHTWQPDAYTNAPDIVTAHIAALVSTTAAYALIRIAYDVFTVAFFAANPLITNVLLAVAAVSIVAGSLLAALQSEVKRTFAYSSVAQFGIVVAAIGLTSETALLGAVIYLVGHALIKATLFLSAGILSSAYGATTIDEYAGLAERAPATTGALAVVALSLVGIPPSVGFLGKWFIGLGAVEAGVWPIAAVIFVSTLLTLSYVAQLIERLYVTPAESAANPDEHAGDDHAGDDHAVADGGLVERGVAVERVAVVVVLAVAVVALFASAGAFADILDPVFGRFFA